MNQRAKISGFTFGIIGGMINAFFGIIALILTIKGPSSDQGGIHPIPQVSQIVLSILSAGLILMCFLNFIGSCVCRNRRTAGGVMMLVSAILLLSLIIISLSDVLFSYSDGPTDITLLLLMAQILSIIGAIICFTGSACPYKIPDYQSYGQPQPPPESK